MIDKILVYLSVVTLISIFILLFGLLLGVLTGVLIVKW